MDEYAMPTCVGQVGQGTCPLVPLHKAVDSFFEVLQITADVFCIDKEFMVHDSYHEAVSPVVQRCERNAPAA